MDLFRCRMRNSLCHHISFPGELFLESFRQLTCVRSLSQFLNNFAALSIAFRIRRYQQVMLREELIPTAIVEDCFPARNFLGLFGLKEPRKTFNNVSRLQTLGLYLPPLQKSLKHSLSVCYVFYQSQIS